MNRTSRLTRTIACALALALGAPSFSWAARPEGDQGASASKSYAVKDGDVDPATVRVVVANLGVGHHVQLRTANGKWSGRIHDIRENTYRVDTNDGVREVAYDETRAIKGTMSRDQKVAIGVMIGIVSTVIVLHWVHRALCEC